jgi:hypothetical protein
MGPEQLARTIENDILPIARAVANVLSSRDESDRTSQRRVGVAITNHGFGTRGSFEDGFYYLQTTLAKLQMQPIKVAVKYMYMPAEERASLKKAIRTGDILFLEKVQKVKGLGKNGGTICEEFFESVDCEPKIHNVDDIHIAWGAISDGIHEAPARFARLAKSSFHDAQVCLENKKRDGFWPSPWDSAQKVMFRRAGIVWLVAELYNPSFPSWVGLLGTGVAGLVTALARADQNRQIKELLEAFKKSYENTAKPLFRQRPIGSIVRAITSSSQFSAG